MSKDKSTPSLGEMVRFVDKIYQGDRNKDKEDRPEKRKPGRPKVYSDKVMTKVFFVMMSKGFPTFWSY